MALHARSMNRPWSDIAPSRSRDEATSLAMRELLDNSNDSVSALLHFAQNVSDDEYEALRRALDHGKVR